MRERRSRARIGQSWRSSPADRPAVSLFYLLSGIVLVYSCTNESGLSATRSSFWRARFARIYPTYLLALMVDGPFFVSAMLKAHDGVSVVLWGRSDRVARGAPAPRLDAAERCSPGTRPGWSVSGRGVLLLAFPDAERSFANQSASQLASRATAFYVLALMPPVVVLLADLTGSPFLLVQVPAGSGGLDVQTWIVRFAGFSPIARLPEFLIGICVGYWLTTSRPSMSSPGATWLEMGTVAGLTCAWLGLGTSADSKIWLDSGLLAPLFALLLIALALGSGLFARLLALRPFQVLGEASYAIYILQEPVLIGRQSCQSLPRCPDWRSSSSTSWASSSSRSPVSDSSRSRCESG